MLGISVRILLLLGLGLSGGLASAQEVEIVNLNIGQGDATLIFGPRSQTGERRVVLFDAGNYRDPDAGPLIARALGERNVRVIDVAIVSHYDSDHIGGIVAGGVHGRSFLLGPDNVPGSAGDDDGDGQADWLGPEAGYGPDPEELGRGDDIVVRRFVDRGDESPPTTQVYSKYLGMARASVRTSLADLAAIENFEIDLGGGARLIALAGNGFVRGRTGRVADVTTENERSLSFLLTHGQFQFLVSGDLIGRRHGAEDARVEAAVADYLRANGISVDVLHANHHGANNGSADEFLAVVRPEIVIVSAGNRNSHGHPTLAAMQRMAEAGVYRIIQTEWGSTPGETPVAIRDRQAIYQGDIVIRALPTSYSVSTSQSFATDE